MAARDNIVVIPLAYNLLLTSDGTTTDSYVQLDVPELEDLGPYIKQITLHSDTQRRTTNFGWNVVIWRSFDGRDLWAGPDKIVTAADITANGYVVQPPLTDVSKFGLKLRAALSAANTTGTAMEQANVSATLVVELIS